MPRRSRSTALGDRARRRRSTATTGTRRSPGRTAGRWRRGRSGRRRRAVPMATMDSPMAMSTISPNARRSGPALRSRQRVEPHEVHAELVDDDGGEPPPLLGVAAGGAPIAQRASIVATRRSWRGSRCAVAVVAGGDEVHAEVGEADDGVGARPARRAALPSPSKACGMLMATKNIAGHRHDHRRARRGPRRRGLVAEPCVGAPPEPDDGRTIRPSRTPTPLTSCSMKPVTFVRAYTKTRSNSSSSGVTRCASSVARTESRTDRHTPRRCRSRRQSGSRLGAGGG